ncbi:MAG TPA: type II toxin-antitoxin system RelE/ParE family toxin [Coxiellaceae bacterium]|nr:type II toxin-antitoxin system RelE/ParE family toxin [Coxiellaceae bacterium]
MQNWLSSLPPGIMAESIRFIELLMIQGYRLRMPHSRSMGAGLFELRPKGAEGAARIFYCRAVGQRIVLLHGFIKKSEKTPSRELIIAIKRMREINYGKKY